jgi:hypothetical protein
LQLSKFVRYSVVEAIFMTSFNIPGTQEYTDELNQEVQTVTAALQKVELMLTTGVVEESVLESFRESVNRVRNTGWIIQKALSEEKGVHAQELLAQERIRCITEMSTQLFNNLEEIESNQFEGLESLQTSIEELLTIVRVRQARLDQGA